MQDRTINNALLALRRQIVLGQSDGREQVETLLRIRGIRFPHLIRFEAAKRGHMAALLLNALRAEPMTQQQAAVYVALHRPEIDADAAYRRAGMCLARLKRKGAVRREGRVWGLAP